MLSFLSLIKFEFWIFLKMWGLESPEEFIPSREFRPMHGRASNPTPLANIFPPHGKNWKFGKTGRALTKLLINVRGKPSNFMCQLIYKRKKPSILFPKNMSRFNDSMSWIYFFIIFCILYNCAIRWVYFFLFCLLI